MTRFYPLSSERSERSILLSRKATTARSTTHPHPPHQTDVLFVTIILDGVGIGVATRLMALYAPDCAISVNSNSRPGLEALTNGKVSAADLAAGRDYDRLLAWLQAQRWYGSAEPPGLFEATAWRYRAALIDPFVAGYRVEAEQELAVPRAG